MTPRQKIQYLIIQKDAEISERECPKITAETVGDLYNELDAQRWQQWMKYFDTPSGTQWAFDAMSAETAEAFTAAIDAAMTGGQP